MTYREAILLGESILQKAKIVDAKNDAWLLLAMACRINHTYYYVHMDEEMSQEQIREYQALLSKRAERIPLQYIVGEQEFMGLKFRVNSNVLIPRQDTETLVEEALKVIEPGMRVLDLCAAPGGKSTQLATYLGDSGLLVSNEINTQRSRILSQNIERMGIKNAIVTNEDSFVLASHFPGFFNAIQVDAPCSGEGMFRKLPEAIEQWSMENVAICAARQKEILDNAAVMLKPGGVIVYSTCTFSKEENEDVIECFLERHPDFTLEEMERFWPHKVDGEGHFVAKLVRRGSVDTDLKADRKTKKNKNSKNRKNETKPALTKENMKLLSEFLDETISEDMAAWIKNSRLVMFGEQLYRLPDMEVDIKGLKVQRAGLHIGEFKKQRFEPSHSLALALKLNDAKNVVKLTWDDPQTTGFFNGQSVMLSDEQAAECKKGWALVCVDGYTAGWGKVNGTQVKNHYPKGLRNKI